jgi:hypothetical protein
MTEAKWLASTVPTPMLAYLRGKASDRKLRLFACACSRRGRTWRLLSDEHRSYTDVAERFADGKASLEELQRAADLTAVVRYEDTEELLRGFDLRTELQAMQEAYSYLLREIVGNPFRPSPPLPAAVLGWNDRTIPRLAEAIYEQRQMPAGTLDTARLAILADALLDAGCADDELMAHCRREGPHVRGCWALDLILGKS